MHIPLVIVGAGGFGREVWNLIQDINQLADTQIDVLGWIDLPGGSEAIYDLPVLGDEEWAKRELSRDVRFVIGLGSAQKRQRIGETLSNQGFQGHTLIHPRATIGIGADIGTGCIICAGAILTVNVTLGTHVMINLNATVGHDTQVNDFASIQPGAHLSGGVRIGQAAEINTGAVILPQVVIGDRTIIGAGAVVNRDCESDTTYIGIPARKILSSHSKEKK